MEFDRLYYNGLVVQGKVRQIMEYLARFPDCSEDLRDYVRIYEEEDYPPLGEEEGLYEILLCYQKYYREVFYLELPEEECLERLRVRLLEHFPHAPRDLDIHDIENGPLQTLIDGKGLHMKPGPIGGYMSPFIWKTNEPRTYHVELPEGVQECSIVFAGDFIFLGWWWYLSMGRYAAGAWVNHDNIVHCDWKSYDLQSEDFNLSMLKHEAQHLMDLNRWPNLSSLTLEYRAILVELIYRESENRLPIYNAKASLDDPDNEYACASYWVCYDFANHFTTDDFESIPIRDIQAYARQLLLESTEACMQNEM